MCLDYLDLILVTFKPPAFRSRAYCDCNPIRAFETFDISREPISRTSRFWMFWYKRNWLGAIKGWRSGPEAFRAGHFLRLDRNRKPRMKKVSGSLGTFHTSRNLLEYIAFSIKTFRAAPFNLFLTARK